MDETYIDIFLSIPPDESLRELIVASMQSLQLAGFFEDSDGVHAYIAKSLWSDSLRREIESSIARYTGEEYPIASISEIQDQDWNAHWEKTIQPIHVTERIVIEPSWNKTLASDGKIHLVIDPKMSFGTGYHETTRIMLHLLEHHCIAHARILDIGTGTGVLSIAAVKLGAASAIGIDTDKWSFQNAQENVRLNNAENMVEIKLGSVETIVESTFDLILANITRTIILSLLNEITTKLKNKGIILLSGFVSEDEAIITKALIDFRYKVLEALRENEWLGIAAMKL
jgi:ribosomal protein L11 methyltransferase